MALLPLSNPDIDYLIDTVNIQNSDLTNCLLNTNGRIVGNAIFQEPLVVDQSDYQSGVLLYRLIHKGQITNGGDAASYKLLPENTLEGDGVQNYKLILKVRCVMATGNTVINLRLYDQDGNIININRYTWSTYKEFVKTGGGSGPNPNWTIFQPNRSGDSFNAYLTYDLNFSTNTGNQEGIVGYSGAGYSVHSNASAASTIHQNVGAFSDQDPPGTNYNVSNLSLDLLAEQDNMYIEYYILGK